MGTVNVDARQVASLTSKIEALENIVASFKAMNEDKTEEVDGYAGCAICASD